MALSINAKRDNPLDFVILNNYVKEEHPDNQRFLKDCEKWFNYPITQTVNEKYHGSIYEVFTAKNILKTQYGSPCTQLLKRELRDKEMREGDVIVVGFTVEEKDRLGRFVLNNEHRVWAPLIDAGITHDECLGIIAKAGIEIPIMYKLGYNNNNCIGCVKGGKGYWNKIRRDFPDVFERMANEEQRIGPNGYLFAPKEKGYPRISLRDLKPNEGRYLDEPSISCGVICELTAEQFEAENDTQTNPS